MAQIKAGDPHGFYRAIIARVGTDGFSYGTSGTGAANGTTMSAYVARYVQSCNLPIPQRTVVDFTSADRWHGSFVYGITSLGSFELSMSVIDADLIALVTGTSVDQTTNQLWTYFSEDIMRDRLPQVTIILTYRLQARGPQDGADLFAHAIIPRAWMSPSGIQGGPSFQTAASYSFQITPTAGTHLPHSLALSDTGIGLQDDAAPMVTLFTDNPVHFVTHLGGGSETDFTVPYKLINNTATLNNSPNELTVGGTLTAADTLVANTGVVTPTGSALTAGEKFGILYETDFTPVDAA